MVVGGGESAVGEAAAVVTQFKCCGKSFRSIKAVHGHMRTHGKGEASSVGNSEEIGVQRDAGGRDKSPGEVFSLNEIEAANALILLKYPETFSSPSASPCREKRRTKQRTGSANHCTKSKKHRTSGDHSGTSDAHACMKCGAVFSSGQALGGHMRKHRGETGVAPVLVDDAARMLSGGRALDNDLNGEPDAAEEPSE